MNSHIPDYLYPYVLGGMATIIAAVLAGLDAALKLAAWPSGARRRIVWSAAAVLIGWSGAEALLASAGFFQTAYSGIPTIQYGILIPLLAGAALFWRSTELQRAVAAVPQHWLVGVQFYRALGMIFLVLYAGGHLPAVFAWPAGAGDVAVGLLAPLAAIAYARKWTHASALVRAWNLLGIADLIIALTTGFLSSPSRFQMLAFGAPNQLIGLFPLAMIPVFAVPLSILFHLASLYKLRPSAGTHRPITPATSPVIAAH
jgi:hypothetical protein